VLALAVVLIGAAAPEYLRLRAFYRADNPFMEKHTLFQRMITWDNFPGPLSRFINANNIKGNVYQDWRWESFLIWYCEEHVQVYLGGRAQTVYSAEQYSQWRTLRQPIGSSQQDRQRPKASVYLPKIGCNLMAHPRRYQDMVMLLCFTDPGQWVPVFYDGHDWLCAYAGSAQTRSVIADVLQDRLEYPSEGVKAVSRALALGANMTRASTGQIVRAIKRAARLQPETVLYGLYLSMVQQDKIPMDQAMAFLQSEAIRLSHEDYRHSGGQRILDAQLYLADRLARAYSESNNSVAQYWRQRRSRLNEIKRKGFYGVEMPPPEPVPPRGPAGSMWPDSP